ncbi:hypothetical protein [Bowdeniella massiliensis]|uniref:hypothetical protein n=1 Tax=Bowdeniella massiliensis TaxID=2932264 RepID=UPI0020293AA9|nr:hypothetical protein [Bowdeniella massiliensis]
MTSILRLRIGPRAASGAGRPLGLVEILDHTGALVGHISRAELSGAEASGTFRFSPISGADVVMGIRRRGVTNPLRNRILIAHASGTDELQERKLANFMRFSADGIVAGQELTIKVRFGGDVAITHGNRGIATLRSLDARRSTVDIVADADERLVGICVLSLLIYRRYEQDVDIAAEYFA